jgi:DNA polymerase-3 subunit alpha
MKYFCNVRLEALKNLEQHVGKTLTFGGIINNVQHRVAKNGKGWGMFTLEGYDENFEFRIFGEEYLKFRHFFIQNNFTYIKILVKEGWVNQETGKRTDPRIQFVEVKQLQDVLDAYAKKLVLLLNIKDVEAEFIYKLNQLFLQNKGEHTVTFEVMELERVRRMVERTTTIDELDDAEFVDNNEVEEGESVENLVANSVAKVEEIEEIKVVTKLAMPSRKVKIKISNELLFELEKMQINFKLN